MTRDNLAGYLSNIENHNCHTRVELGIQLELNSCKYHLASWATKWHDYVPVDHPPDELLEIWEQHLLVVWKCSRRFLEGVWKVWKMSGRWLEVVWKESGGCLEGDGVL